MADRVGEFITVTQWHYKVRNRGRVEGYPVIDGEGREEGLDHKRTVGKMTLILQGIGVDAPRWKVIEQQDPLPYGRGDDERSPPIHVDTFNQNQFESRPQNGPGGGGD